MAEVPHTSTTRTAAGPVTAIVGAGLVGSAWAIVFSRVGHAAREALEAFDAEWGRWYPSIAQARRRTWQEVIPFFAFSPEIRRVIDTTNAVESLNRVIQKATKTRGCFPSEEAAEKLIYLAIRGHQKRSRTVRGWLTAVNQFAITFEDRFTPMRG